MKKIKNIIAIIIILLLMLVTLTGCTNNEEKEKENERESKSLSEIIKKEVENSIETESENETKEQTNLELAEKEENKNPIATMQVEYENQQGQSKIGTIKIELYKNEAPETVSNFINLANNGFYNGLTFHRILKDFVIQGGDPAGDGTGAAKRSDLDKSIVPNSEDDYQYSIKGEFAKNNVDNNLKFEKGVVGLARSDYSAYGLVEEGYNSGNCQFFIVNSNSKNAQRSLEGLYTAFGKVIEGYEIVEEISNVELKAMEEGNYEQSTPIVAPIIKKVEIQTYGETYKAPQIINAEDTERKLQEIYIQYMNEYYKNLENNEE